MKQIVFLFLIISLFACKPSDEQLWHKAKILNTVSAFKLYLKESKQGLYVDSAKLKIEELIWEQALHTKSIESYIQYLKLYKNGKYKIDAKWGIAQLENKFGFYEDFIEEFPNSSYEKNALDSINFSQIKWLKEIKNNSFVHNIIALQDTGFVLVGANGSLNKTWIAKFDNEGNNIFTRNNSHSGSNEQYRDIISLSNDNLLIGGYTSGNSKDGFLITKLNATGNIVWERVYKDLISGIILDVTCFPDSNFIAVGESANVMKQTNNSKSVDVLKNEIMSYLDFLVHKARIKHIGAESSGSNSISGFIVSFDKKGDIIWQKSIAHNGSNLLSLNKVLVTNDSFIIVAGKKGRSNMIFYKFNKKGDTVWEKEFKEYGNVVDMIQITTGEIIIAAYKYRHPFDNVFILKLSSTTGDIVEEKIIKDKNYSVCAVLPTKDSGYILLGQNNISTNGYIWLVKFKQNGEIHWERTIKGGITGISDMRIVKTYSNDYLICGTIKQLYSSKGVFILKL